MGKPVLGINNLDLVRNVLVKDFDNFTDRNSALAQEAFTSGGDLDKVKTHMCTYVSLSSSATYDSRA
jgi:hypothetical protein